MFLANDSTIVSVPPTVDWEWQRDLDCTIRSFSDHTGILDGCALPILTVFTTMNDSSEESVECVRKQHNTIINWASLGSCVQPVLYVNDTDSDLADFALKNGWLVQSVPHTIQGMKSRVSVAFVAPKLVPTHADRESPKALTNTCV